ncbi:MAG: S8 family peptidase [Kordia sp.]|uniref:S8 family peptidase n=1 Tax=Kordia sp. TaxID=1965332 RepID=UPI00385EF1A4
MKPLKPIITLLLSCIITACTSSKITVQKPQAITASFIKTKPLTKDEKQNWQHKDIIEDTIAGISLDKAYRELLKNKKGDTVIVAVIDMRIHKNHEDIKEFIWVNSNEIPNNNIDDDKNGYIDDVHGWNFLGNSKGQQVYRANFEYVRIIRKFKEKFKNKKREEIDSIAIKDYDLYQRAKEAYSEELRYVNRKLRSLNYKRIRKSFLEEKIKNIYKDSTIHLKFLQSLKLENETLQKDVNALIRLKNDSIKNASSFASEKRYLDIYLNTDFPEREIIGDDVNDINDIHYGNNKVTSDNSEGSHIHAIKVAGIIAANRSNALGIKGITNKVKIMPVAISPYGDEHDKDIALAIRYAIDNGAKIINMSSGKYFSMHKEWVMDALKYADEKDVLVITSAGNRAENLDEKQNYPNDLDEKNYDVLKNFIKVGASTYELNENIIHYTSNYGKENVDIFAPGKDIYTTHPNNTYGFSSGTSFSAPIVSGIAALIRSYYPNLSASEVKSIILNSGVFINWEVNKPPTRNNKELVPFNSLSKSGKIVNAYNALLMAEQISKKQQRKK